MSMRRKKGESKRDFIIRKITTRPTMMEKARAKIERDRKRREERRTPDR